MERDWVRLGRLLAEARKAIGLTQADAAARIGVTRTAIQSIEHGDVRVKITGTMRGYARLVGWDDGSLEDVVAGGEPAPAAMPGDREPGEVERPRTLDDLNLPPLIQEELRDGQVLGTGVYDLTPEGSTAQLIVVVKGPSDATADDIRRYAQAWRQAERRIRELPREDGSNV